MKQYSNFELCLSQGALNAFIHLQNFIVLPYAIEPGTYKPRRNSKFQGCCQAFTRFFVLTFMGLHLLFALYRISFIISNSGIYSYRPTEQLFLNIIVVAMAYIAISSYLFGTRNTEEAILLISSSCEAGLPKQTLAIEKRRRLGDIFVYGFCLSAMAYPFLVSVVPYIWDFDPIQIIILEYFKIEFESVRGLYSARVAVSVHYVTLAAYGAALWLCPLLFLMITSEGLNKLTHDLYPKSCRRAQTSKRQLSSVFPRYYDRFRVTQLLTMMLRLASRWHIQNTVVVGVLVASCASYFNLRMRNEIPFSLAIACAVITITVFSMDFLFIHLFSKTNKNGEEFRRFWKSVLMRRLDRRRLVSCPEIGYAIGTFKYIQNYFALDIADTILRNISSAVLIK